MHKKRVMEVDFGLLSKEWALASYRNGFKKRELFVDPSDSFVHHYCGKV